MSVKHSSLASTNGIHSIDAAVVENTGSFSTFTAFPNKSVFDTSDVGKIVLQHDPIKRYVMTNYSPPTFAPFGATGPTGATGATGADVSLQINELSIPRRINGTTQNTYLARCVTEPPFGVVMNNVALATQNTVAFQAAINYGITNRTKITIPEGTLFINGPLFTGNATSSYSGLIIEGAGDGTGPISPGTMIQCDNDTVFTGSMLQLRGISGCQIRNLAFYPNQKADVAIQQIHAPGDTSVTRNITYENVLMYNGLKSCYNLGNLTSPLDTGDCLATTFNKCIFGTQSFEHPTDQCLVYIKAQNTYNTTFNNCRWYVGFGATAKYGILATGGTFIVNGGLVENMTETAIGVITATGSLAAGCQINGLQATDMPCLLWIDNSSAAFKAVFPVQTIGCVHYQNPTVPTIHSVMYNASGRTLYTDIGSSFSSGIQALGTAKAHLLGTHLEATPENGFLANATNVKDDTIAYGTWDVQGEILKSTFAEKLTVFTTGTVTASNSQILATIPLQTNGGRALQIYSSVFEIDVLLSLFATSSIQGRIHGQQHMSVTYDGVGVPTSHIVGACNSTLAFSSDVNMPTYSGIEVTGSIGNFIVTINKISGSNNCNYTLLTSNIRDQQMP